MWYKWATLVLVCCALVKAEVEQEEANSEQTTTIEEATTTEPSPVPLATTRAPPRTLDRHAAELAWRTWLQSPESGNQNAPPRRITTKSLFITPLVCPKGPRLDGNGCVQGVTINKDEHERNLLAQLNALFTPAPATGGDLYDYGDDEPGPLQLSIPIGLDPLAAPLQGQDPLAQSQDQQNFVKHDKKDKPDGDSSLEAELEILKLQNTNYTAQSQGSYGVDHNDLTNVHLHQDKPKRDSIAVNVTDGDSTDKPSEEVGQKEVVFGHVNVDPILYHLSNEDSKNDNVNKETQTEQSQTEKVAESTITENILSATVNKAEMSTNATGTSNDAPQVFKKDGDQTKLNPENDYSDIGEAIKLISRYAEVTTDDNFAKDQKKNAATDDSVLGTRTRLQHRRNKPKGPDIMEVSPSNDQPDYRYKPTHNVYPKNGVYYRYPWPGQHAPTPPPDYPFRHIQDYWPGRNKFGGVYNIHENPRRHHHSYPHSLRPHGNPYVSSPNFRDAIPEQLKGYIHRVAQRHLSPVRPRSNNQDLYTLLGLRHWFSSEGTSKR